MSMNNLINVYLRRFVQNSRYILCMYMGVIWFKRSKRAKAFGRFAKSLLAVGLLSLKFCDM